MTREEALDKLCHSYSGYFDVVRHEEPKGYLVAEAGLHIHSEKYVLVKAAKLWEADNNEYVYIFSVPVLTKEIFEQCREQARADGMQRIEPGPNHHGILASVLYIPKSIVDYAVMVGNQSRGQRIVIGKRRGRIGGKHHGLYPVCRHAVQVGSLIHVGIVPAKTDE